MFTRRSQKLLGLISIFGAMLFLGVDKFFLRENGAWIAVSFPFLMDDFFQSLMNQSSGEESWGFLSNNVFYAWVLPDSLNRLFGSREIRLMKRGKRKSREGSIRIEPFFHIPSFLWNETESRWPKMLWGLFRNSWKS